jgi:hypothetical protein
MEVFEITEPIAVRDLYLTDTQGSKRKVQVLIGKPEPFPESEGYSCPFQIVGIGSEKVKYAAGIDAVQALQLVMVMIGATPQFLKRKLAEIFGGKAAVKATMVSLFLTRNEALR